MHLCATVQSLNVMRCRTGIQWSWSRISLDTLAYGGSRRTRRAEEHITDCKQLTRPSSVCQDIVTIVQLTLDHRTDELSLRSPFTNYLVIGPTLPLFVSLYIVSIRLGVAYAHKWSEAEGPSKQQIEADRPNNFIAVSA